MHNPETREIMVTQYRVAENSAVINTLIAAAQNGKKVTVFVELKARRQRQMCIRDRYQDNLQHPWFESARQSSLDPSSRIKR